MPRVLLTLLLLCLAGTTFAAPQRPELRASSHLLVKLKQDARPHVRGKRAADGLTLLGARLGLPDGARLEEPFLNQSLRKKRNAQNLAASDEVDLDRFLYLRLPAGWTVDRAIALLEHHPLVDYVEPDGMGSGGDIMPDDPSFSLQWHHRNTVKPGADIHTPAAWEITTGSSNVIVAVLDTGLALGSPEFAGRLVPGYDFVNEDANPADDHGHGTSVAGTLAATGNNGTLVAGVDWKCRIMPLKVLDNSNNGLYSWWAQAVDYAVSNGCKVINLSAGGFTTSTTLTRAIDNAITQGVVFVTITHNDSSGTVRYPGSLLQAITVGATDQSDRRATFSNFGPAIDLVGPGNGIVTTSLAGGLNTWQGTSFAAPQVSGVCALMAAVRPNLNQESAMNYLKLGADDRVGDATDLAGWDQHHGWGRLNAFNSLLLAASNTSILLLTQKESSDPASVTCELTYELTVTNQGVTTLTGVQVTNHFPLTTSLSMAESSQGSHSVNGHTILFDIGPIAPLSSAQMIVRLSPGGTGVVTNRAGVRSDQTAFNAASHVSMESTTLQVDNQPPQVLSATALANGQGVALSFSEPLSPPSAIVFDNYMLLDGYTNLCELVDVQLSSDRRTVVLVSPLLARFGPFSVTVVGLQDCMGNDLTGHPPVSVAVPEISLIANGVSWKFLDNGSNQGTSWREVAFDDTAWAAGLSEFGYGDGDETTTVSFGPNPNARYITTYFRYSLAIADRTTLTNVLVHLLRDDGGAVYLNGTEILRNNLPAGTLLNTTLAVTNVEGSGERSYVSAQVDPTLLVNGLNVVAVEVHQASASSTDLSFNLSLTASLRQLSMIPVILSSPESQVVVQGDTVTFQVTVAGPGPFGFRWRHGTDTIVPFGSGTTSLVLSNVQPSDAGEYSVVVTNASAPVPGVISSAALLTVLADSDGDHMPDGWEQSSGLLYLNPSDAALDPDNDGFNSLQEYRAGTNPTNGASYLKVDRLDFAAGQVHLRFTAVSNKTYSVIYRDSDVGSWSNLGHVGARSTTRVETISDTPLSSQRYYRLVTPRQP